MKNSFIQLIYSALQRSISTFACAFVLLAIAPKALTAQIDESLIRTFPASCENVCNGSAEFLQYRTVPERYYFWMSYQDGLYHPMNDPILEDLCSGKYRIRQVDILYEAIAGQVLVDESIPEFEGLCTMSFSSLGKREVSIYVKLDMEVNYLNYYMRSQYSTDGGLTWKFSSQFHQKVVTDHSGSQQIQYLMNLPKSASNLKDLQIRIYRRKKDEYNDPPMMHVSDIHVESKRLTECVFEIMTEDALKIQSTVSNELKGKDGYISLNIVGGSPPYVIAWEGGEVDLQRKGLTAGTYQVKVTDRRNCSQTAEFVVLPPEGADRNGVFRLERVTTEGLYRLKIVGLYRQPLDLIISDNLTQEVKHYTINPLYQDLSMDLDLSYLRPGSYSATLSTAGYSKKTDIHID